MTNEVTYTYSLDMPKYTGDIDVKISRKELDRMKLQEKFNPSPINRMTQAMESFMTQLTYTMGSMEEFNKTLNIT